MTIIDPIRDNTKPNSMRYVEFLVFLCRMSFEHYERASNGIYSKELLYLKLDHLMPAFLAYLNLQPLFLFGEKFKFEEEEEKLRAKRKRQKLRRATVSGKAIDPRLIAEVRAYEDSLVKAGMGSFKAS